MSELAELIEDENFEGVQSLLESDPKLAAGPEGTNQPIHIAANQGFADIVKLLVQHGADVNARDEDERTPLHHASSSHVDAVTFLLHQGANPNVVDRFGYTPLLWAITQRQPESESIVNLLIDHGADYDLAAAAVRGDVDRVTSILKDDPAAITRVANPRRVIAWIWPAEQYWPLGKRPKIVRLLLENGLAISKDDLLNEANKCYVKEISETLVEHANRQG